MSAPAPTLARSLPEICVDVRRVNCGECWQVPGTPCTLGGDHVARFGRAARRGLISGRELVAVLGRLEAFTTATVVETSGRRGAMNGPQDYDEIAQMPLADVLNRFQALERPRLDGPLHRRPAGPWHVPAGCVRERGAIPAADRR